MLPNRALVAFMAKLTHVVAISIGMSPLDRKELDGHIKVIQDAAKAVEDYEAEATELQPVTAAFTIGEHAFETIEDLIEVVLVGVKELFGEPKLGLDTLPEDALKLLAERVQALIPAPKPVEAVVTDDLVAEITRRVLTSLPAVQLPDPLSDEKGGAGNLFGNTDVKTVTKTAKA